MRILNRLYSSFNIRAIIQKEYKHVLVLWPNCAFISTKGAEIRPSVVSQKSENVSWILMQTKIITHESFLIISCHFCNMLHVIFIFYFRNATQQLQRNTVSLREASQDSAHRPLKCRLVLMEMRKVNVIGHWIGHSDSLRLLYLMKVCCHTTFWYVFY